jgi:hypothetical protein
MDPRVRELVMLSALAGLGCGLAAVQGDLLFVAIFSAACAVTIIEAIRSLQWDHRVRGVSVAIRVLRELYLGIVSGRLLVLKAPARPGLSSIEFQNHAAGAATQNGLRAWRTSGWQTGM